MKKYISVFIIIIFLATIVYLILQIDKKNKIISNINTIKLDTTKISKNISLNGIYEGSAKGKQMYLVIDNFDGKNFMGYSIVYWNLEKETKADFTGNYDSINNMVYIYESNDLHGAGKFEGNFKENKLQGNWHRYSDNGSYSWSLQKSNKSINEIQSSDKNIQRQKILTLILNQLNQIWKIKKIMNEC